MNNSVKNSVNKNSVKENNLNNLTNLNRNQKKQINILREVKKKIINNQLQLINNKKKLLYSKAFITNSQIKNLCSSLTSRKKKINNGSQNEKLNKNTEKNQSITSKVEPNESIINPPINHTNEIRLNVSTNKPNISVNNSNQDGGYIETSKNIPQINSEIKVINTKLDIFKKQSLSVNGEIKKKISGFRYNNQTIFEKIKSFLKGEFFSFIKYYLYFIILFTIVFYITIYINNNTKNNMIIIETKIFFYIGLIILFIIMNDILETPVESINKFLYIILFTLIIIYIVIYLVQHYYIKNDFFDKLILILFCVFIIFISMIIYIYFIFEKKDNNIAKDLFNSFNNGLYKNLFLTIFFILYIIAYYIVFNILDINSNLSDIIAPFNLGLMLLFFIFILIIYIGIKIKIINKMQILNTFISLSAICIFLLFVCAQIFMSSLGNICTSNETTKSVNEQEFVSLLILASIFVILWLDDSRNWRQSGSLMFIITTIIALYCMFYYSVIYPSTGILSFWLFIEWLIIIFYRKENSKNSIHYLFMKT